MVGIIGSAVGSCLQPSKLFIINIAGFTHGQELVAICDTS